MTKISVLTCEKTSVGVLVLSGLVLELPLPMCGWSPEGLSGCLALAFGRNRDLGTAHMVHMEIWANRLACLLAKAYNFCLFLS